jgi:hypothetical protein
LTSFGGARCIDDLVGSCVKALDFASLSEKGVYELIQTIQGTEKGVKRQVENALIVTAKEYGRMG